LDSPDWIVGGAEAPFLLVQRLIDPVHVNG